MTALSAGTRLAFSGSDSLPAVPRLLGMRPLVRGLLCYAGLGPGMHPRNFVFITLLALCHPQLSGQMLTNALPPANAARLGALASAQTPSRNRRCPTARRSTETLACRKAGACACKRHTHSLGSGAPVTEGRHLDAAMGRWWSTIATTFCAPTRSSITSRHRSWMRTAICRLPAAPKMSRSKHRTATCGSTCTRRASSMSPARSGVRRSGARSSSTRRPIRFYSRAACCCRPAKAATASLTAP